MTIAIITQWFSENMSYAENKLPVALAKEGCNVHLISSDMQVYANEPDVYRIYEPFLGPAIVQVGVTEAKGYTFHRIPHYITRDGIGLKGLFEKLQAIKPDLVYLFEINMEHTLQVVKYKPVLNYKIFCESRLHLSIFNPPKSSLRKLYHHLRHRVKWRAAGLSIDKFYPIAPDVLHVITEYYGQEKSKCEISSLAVDTDAFHPISTDEELDQRLHLRSKLGFNNNDIVCIYTGRFTDDKGPLLLAEAIDHLHGQGFLNYKGLFVGTGDEQQVANISGKRGCTIHPFVKSSELLKFYQCADIGVWPKQESTSQLDAIACGLPLIISSNVEDINRISGNGLAYDHGDMADLAVKIKSLEDLPLRKKLGSAGVAKILQSYSWGHIARSRIKDFAEAYS